MSEQKHVIKRQVIELTMPNQGMAPALQDEISRIYRKRIVPLIDQYCTELGAPDRLYRIDSLELDLGTLDIQDLEEQFVARVKNLLRKELAAHITQQEAASASDQPPRTISALELFVTFVSSGNLPWWADHQQPTLLTENLQTLLDERPAAFIPLLQGFLRNSQTRQRIIRQYDETQLGQLGVLLTPAYREIFLRETLTLIATLQKTKTGRSWPPYKVQQSVWSHTLQVAALGSAEHSPTFAEFSQAILERVANELGRPILSEMRGSENQPSENDSGTNRPGPNLSKQLKRLRSHSPEALTTPWTELESLAPRFSAALRKQLRQALASESASPQQAAERVLEILQTSEYANLTRQFRLALGQPEGGLATLLRKLRSRGGPLTEFWDTLRGVSAKLSAQAQAEWLAMFEAAENNPSPITIVQFLSTSPHADGLSTEERARLLNLLRQEPAAPMPDLRFSQADEISVTNAGLVILWPFLTSFFTHLELLEERDFKDLAARQRAVGLLQVLASGQADAPEYLLPLNKLLCNLEMIHPFEFGLPLSKRETRECKNLLKAVIAQVPILNNMSVDAFRGTFLLRTGLLTRQSGHWLLRVERQTYDIVLERFAWNWEWVRLPWMPAPLRVEW